MKWNNLTSEELLDNIIEKSCEYPVVIFKHSTRCSISSMVLNRLERSWNSEEMKKIEPYYLDLITFRAISNKIAEMFGVVHESPQLLIIKDKSCVYNVSHTDISYNELSRQIKSL